MDSETDAVNNLQVFKDRCLELEEKNKTYELKCLMLEDEVEKLKKQNKELEAKIKTIQNIILIEDEEDEGDKFIELMTENKVLTCEKTKAETEVCSLKDKGRESTSQLCELESNNKCTNEIVNEDISQVRNRLLFEKLSPSTPGVFGQPFYDFIDVVDDDSSDDNVCIVNKRSHAKSQVSSSTKRKRATNIVMSDDENIVKDDKEDMCGSKVHSLNTKSATNIVTSDSENSSKDDKEDMGGSKFHFLNTKSATNIVMSDNENSSKDVKEDMGRSKVNSLNTGRVKRKRAVNIVNSDDDISCDDSAPICTLVKKRRSSRCMKDSDDEVKNNGSTRYLKRLRKLVSENIQDESVVDMNKTICLDGNSLSEDEEDNDENLSDEFIDDDCESVSDGSLSKSGGGCDESESEDDYKETIDKIGRKKASNMKMKWDFEGDMLSDFGKDNELCMRAVCAIYRQQTEDEKASKVTIHVNKRGFSQTDAYRATKLAEFLTDPGDDLNKTVEELKQFDSMGVEQCRIFAIKYSKQLFEIYQNKEDEYFRPPC